MTNLPCTDFRKDVYQTAYCQPPTRTRSVYTALSYQTDDSSYQSFSGDYKYFDAASSGDQWTIGANVSPNYSTTSLWRPPRVGMKTTTLPLSYYSTEEACLYTNENWREQELLETNGAVIATQHGTMSIRLHSMMRVDMTIDRAIRIINFKNNIVMALSATGSSSALLHPNGRIYQYGSRVEIMAHDIHGNNKYAKMWYKGVSFTTEHCALVYLVDSAGTRTTTDSFSDLMQDFSLNVYYKESRHGPMFQQDAMNLLQKAQYFVCDKGVQNWVINNVRVSQTPDGLVRIARNSNKYQIRSSPTNGSATITTPFLHTTASLGQTSHLFVRRGERRMHYDGTSFIVRNAGHSAGFDEKNMLKVY